MHDAGDTEQSRGHDGVGVAAKTVADVDEVGTRLCEQAAQAQRELLNIELQDLQQALMRAWRLPELLVQINAERHAETAQVRNVLLAVRLARHTARDWDTLGQIFAPDISSSAWT